MEMGVWWMHEVGIRFAGEILYGGSKWMYEDVSLF